MKVLIDTHVFLWWSSERGARISDIAREILEDGRNEVSLSLASVWEMAIKVGRGRVDLPAPIERYLPDRIERHGFDLLPIEWDHAIRSGSLPPIHGDPFDRMLIAQAQVEGIPLLTADPVITRYDVDTIW